MKRFLSLLTAAALALSLVPAGAFATEGDTAAEGLCPHHSQHDASCGYSEGTPEIPCTHIHTAECETSVTLCVHTHTEQCYSDGILPAEGGEKEADACAHVCSVETGCITKAPDCKHEHDEACGYAPATPGTPCAYDCQICRETENEPAQCTCESKCSEGTLNSQCPVCAADPSGCTGKEPEPPAPTCTCTVKCTEGAVNVSCPVCAADPSSCIGKEPEPPAPTCTCTVKCTEGTVNVSCPVCGTDPSSCTGKEPEPPAPTCTCTVKCTEGAVNVSCPVCGTDGANLSACAGTESQPEPPQVVTISEWSWVDTLPALNPDGKLYLPQAVTAESQDGIIQFLPQSIQAGEKIIPITWAYDPATQTFTAVLPEGFTLAEGANPLTVAVVVMGGSTLEEMAVEYIGADGQVQNVTAAVVTNNRTAWDGNTTSGWNVVSGDVTISQRVTVSGDVKLILTDGCNFTVTGGIQVSTGSSLTIYSQSAGTGKLTADASNTYGASGIGGTNGISSGDSGDILIYGGTIEAKGGQNAAGIGGGTDGNSSNIRIYGGNVTATGNSAGAGIGSGYDSDGIGDIIISGGTVIATSTGQGAGIGNGDFQGSTTGSITITGGNVTAVSGSGQGTDGPLTISPTMGYSITVLAGADAGSAAAVDGSPFTQTTQIQDKVGSMAYFHSSTEAIVTDITLSQTSLTLNPGSSTMLIATVVPSYAAGKTINWFSSNEAVARVEGGKVTAVSAGQATITAAVDGKKATCQVIVNSMDLASAKVTLGSFLTYNGGLQTQAIASVTLNSKTLTEGTDYTIAKNTGKDAGTYTLTITGTGDYTGTLTVPFKIAKAPLTITNVDVQNKTYDGTTTATVTGVTFAGLQNGEALAMGTDYTALADFADASAGTGKSITGKVTLFTSAIGRNYTLNGGSFTTSGDISTAPSKLSFKADRTKPLKGQYVTFSVTPQIKGDNRSFLQRILGINAPKVEFWANATTKLGEVKVEAGKTSTFAYDTDKGGLKLGKNTVTAEFTGDGNLKGCTESIEIYLHDSTTSAPTGDESNIQAWTAVLVISAVALIGLGVGALIYRKRKK